MADKFFFGIPNRDLHRSMNSVFKLRRLQLVFVGLVSSFVGACVSVNLPGSKSEKKASYTYGEPSAPFEKFFPEHVDVAWKNDLNQSLAVISECGEDLPTPSESAADSVRSLSQNRVLKREVIRVAGLEAVRQLVETKEQNTLFVIDSVVVKSENCLVTLNFVSSGQYREKNRKVFEDFLNQFAVKQ
jgi:hypothetical protein